MKRFGGLLNSKPSVGKERLIWERLSLVIFALLLVPQLSELRYAIKVEFGKNFAFHALTALEIGVLVVYVSIALILGRLARMAPMLVRGTLNVGLLLLLVTIAINLYPYWSRGTLALGLFSSVLIIVMGVLIPLGVGRKVKQLAGQASVVTLPASSAGAQIPDEKNDTRG